MFFTKNKTNKSIALSFIFNLMDICFIGIFFATFFKEKNYGNMSIVAVLLVLKNISSIFADIPSGILANKINSRSYFAIARLTRILSLLLLYFKHYTLGMIVYGFSMSGFSGKINSYIYNILKKHNEEGRYQKIISSFYMFTNAGYFISGPVAIFMHKKLNHSYEALIIASIIFTALSVPLLFFMENIKNETQKKKYMLKEIKPWLLNRDHLIKVSNMSMLFLMMWQYGNLFNLSLNAYNIDRYSIVLARNCLFALSITSSFLSYKLNLQINHNKVAKILMAQVTLITISSFINQALMSVCCLVTLAIAPFLMSNTENSLERSLESKFRYTVSSISTSIASTLNISMSLLFGYIINSKGAKLSISFSILPVALIFILFNLTIKKLINNVSQE